MIRAMRTNPLRVRVLALCASAALAVGCASRTIAGGALPDGATVDDVPIASDVASPDAVFPDVPLRPDVILPDRPPPDATLPDITFPDVPRPDVPTPATNGQCSNAVTLTPGVTLTNQNTAFAAEVGAACSPVGFVAPSLWYRVAVPSGQTLTVTTTRSLISPANVQPRFQTSCAPGVCLIQTTSGSQDGRSVISRWSNTSASPVVVFVTATPQTGLPPGLSLVFDITASLRAASSNATCDRATEVTDGTTLVGEDPNTSSTTRALCPGMTGAILPGTLFYTVSVPAGQTLTTQVAPTAGGRGGYFTRVLGACSDVACLAASTVGSLSASTWWTNTSTASRRVVLAVSPNLAGSSPFDLTVRVRPPPANAMCAGATRLSSGSLVGESLMLAHDVTEACLASGATSGPVLYYAARVGEGERLTVVARSASSTLFNPLVRVIDGCSGLTCLATSVDTIGSVASARVTWVNPGAARDVVVLVSSSTSASAEFFDLTTAVGAPLYGMTSIPGACDTLAAPTVVTSAIGDNRGSGSIALPFSFRYFNAAVATWSVSTNGYMQLWPVSGVSTGALGATELPASTAPISMVAPFWDDLEVDAGAASVRSQVFAGAARHLTVEWNNVRFCCGGSAPDRQTFQVKLFEASNLIEFHYCSLGASTRASGGNASIGIQDVSTAQGLSWAVRRTGAATTSTGVRFTPM